MSSDVVLSYRKLLHEEETNYFANLAKNATEQAKQAREARQAPKPDLPTTVLEEESADADATVASQESSTVARSDRLSFGDGEVKIIQVETLDREGQPCSMYYTGERLRIKVTCESFVRIDKLNVAVRLRNKEGVKIYSWGTLNQDMTTRARRMEKPVFWERRFEMGDRFQVVLECDCDLGENLYEVQASVSYEGTMNYLSQRMLHWVDEAVFSRYR